MTKNYYSNGKLLLSGEYAILDGALSLALPTSYGQHLKVSETDSKDLVWKSVDNYGAVWFEFNVDLRPGIKKCEKQFIESSTPPGNPIAKTLLKILKAAQNLNRDFLSERRGYLVETTLDFPRDWGLGSSSTLINNIAQWAKIDAFQLLWNSFSGSGYDIACAQHNHPILYRLEGKSPHVVQVDFDPPFKDHLYFIHLNQKQDSREGIARYRLKNFDKPTLVEHITEITKKIATCQTLESFEILLEEHETLLSDVLKIPTVKKQLFHDYTRTIKSLGAWGGDFVLATGGPDTPDYFSKKGYQTCIPYSEIILS